VLTEKNIDPQPQLGVRGSLRLWLIRLHRWSGFTLMACLLVAAATGVWLVFRQELDRALHSRLRIVTPAATQLSEDEIVSRVETAFPAAFVTLLQFPLRPDESVSLDVTPRQSGARLPFDRVYVNQHTGELLGERNTRSGVTLDSLDSLILGLHFELLAGSWGYRIMGVVAFVWLLSNLVGMALAWPRFWMRFRSWIPILATRTSNTYLLNYDLHRAGGVWLLPVLTVLAFTSVALNLPEYFRPMVEWFSPLSRQPPGTRIRPEDARVTFGQANAAVRRMYPEARTNNIFRDLGNGRYSVYFHLPEDANPQGDNFALIDLKTGTMTAVQQPARGSAGDRFMAWLYPLHTGGAFGWAGRLLVALAGIVVVVLNITGLYTWCVRWQSRRRQSARRAAGMAR
jgi:uncharacterized iron-regulated membrane protein